MDNCNPKFPCCPPETANVVQVQSVAGIKGLNNCFVYVQSINTSFYVDNAHRITWISSGVVEESNYDLQANPLNLRNQFLYDPSTKEVHYFSNTGYDATFAATVSLEDLQALEQKINANSAEIASVSNLLDTTIDTINQAGESITELQTKLATETTAREEADQELQTQITVNETETNENTARIEQNSASITTLNNTLVQTDTAVSADDSTVSLTKTMGELSGEKTATEVPLPVASETSAGVMNSATYQAIQNNSENVDAILNGAVALENLSATPTQEDLTNAWEEATGKTGLVNRASIYDVANDKVWYYYENINEWKPLTATAQGEITVSTFTNETAGIIKGSENDGQLFAEADGTGSVVGWDTVKADIVNLNNELDGIEIPKLPMYIIGSSTGDPFRSIQNSVGAGLVFQRWNVSAGSGMGGQAVYIPTVNTQYNGLMIPADKAKLDALPAITSIGENLELTDDGVLNASGGGGSDVTLLTGYNASPADGDVYNAAYVNGRLDGDEVILGSGAIRYNPTRGIGVTIGKLSKGNTSGVAIGFQSDVGNGGIAIGSQSKGYSNGVAIGYQANNSSKDYAIALGNSAINTRNGEVSIGNPNLTATFKTRFLANVTAGELDTDAVNVSQLNALQTNLQGTIDDLLSEIATLQSRIAALEAE